ncbi:maturation protein [ssRNA phage Zoerhiza.4_16]|uniref:Maturation protein n=2 Tax=Leviviricetes TaxID=2842243 RepID=A0A8S5L4B9_9VIRU|nr:maturation protein [ssRNA phage Zoerhiza.4_16]QDH89185.1 MAG: hypothetical protein H4Rhizo44336_000003 [Leviviridae sp.]DAD52181.1 TPA_asm: maturation protein [ssRNA phage Zoerhiza.4_16]
MFIQRGRTRARTVPGPHFYSKEQKKNGLGVWVDSADSTVNVALDGTQITESDGNLWPPPKGSPLEDRGSEFFTQKKEVVNTKFPYQVLNFKGNGYTADCRLLGNLMMANCFDSNAVDPPGFDGRQPPPLKWSFPPDLSSSRSALEVKGAIAVAACAPTNQIAQVASFVGELLQDVPKIPGIALWESRLRAIAALAATGDEFLNFIFGIKPTLGDMGDFLKAVHKVDKRVDQFIRDSGRTVRRNFHFPEDVTVDEVVLPHRYSPVGSARNQITSPPENNFATNFFAQNFGNGHPCRETIRTRTTKRKIWFSGAFTYHLPGGYDSHSQMDRRKLMAELFGARPDLNTLWQLTPWSWAVDWVLDTGAFVKNLQSHIRYGQVMRYGYVMEETTTTDTYSAGRICSTVSDSAFIPPSKPYYAVLPPISDVSFRITTKKRIQANPFGFGVSWDGLSTIQQAIVAALGITRAVR